jgi:hypothetical protein
MSVPFYSFRSIIEDNISSYLQTQFPALTVHKGITDEIRVIPLVICHAESAQNIEELGSQVLGNYQANLKVYIYSSADDETLDQHRTRVAEVIGALSDVDTIKAGWQNGQLYMLYIQSDEEGMSQRRYGNVLEYTIWGVLPAQP